MLNFRPKLEDYPLSAVLDCVFSMFQPPEIYEGRLQPEDALCPGEKGGIKIVQRMNFAKRNNVRYQHIVAWSLGAVA
jgi:hypothetical protein